MTPSHAIAVTLLVLTAVAYSPVLRNDFISYDDRAYVLKNEHVRGGITAENFVWAFTTLTAGNWHPLTWLSHMGDVELFGLNAHGHHLSSLVLHATNSLLLLFVLRGATGALLRSGCVAALFALHPLHVESVAWVAERKDVLSAFFWILGLAAYLRYARRPRLATYLPLLATFALGLLSKPMLVSFPFVLLLLDFWPLGRWGHSIAADGRAREPAPRRTSCGALVGEKIPLFILSAVVAGVTFYAQDSGGSVAGLAGLGDGFAVTVPNVPLAYVGYLEKTFWPSGLAVFYPHSTHDVAAARWVPALLLLAAITAGAIVTRRTRPYFAVGWLWYLIALAPVSGLLQVGAQSMADRYTYLPLLGVFLGLTWGAPELLGRVPAARAALRWLSCAILLALAAVTFRQAGFWRNDRTLFTHALAVTSGNWLAHSILGRHFIDEGDWEAADQHFSAALALRPNLPSALFFQGVALQQLGRLDQALERYRALVRLSPDSFDAYYNMGAILLRQGKCAEARGQARNALRLNPEDAEARTLLDLSRVGVPPRREMSERRRADQPIACRDNGPRPSLFP